MSSLQHAHATSVSATATCGVHVPICSHACIAVLACVRCGSYRPFGDPERRLRVVWKNVAAACLRVGMCCVRIPCGRLVHCAPRHVSRCCAQRQCSMCSLYFCGTCLPLEHRLPHDLTVRSLPLGGGRAGGLNGPSDAVGGSAVITPRTFTSTFACSKCLAANCGLDVAVYAKAAANADTTADTPFDDSSHFNQAEATKVAKLCQAGYEKESAISSEVLAPLGMKLVGVVSIPHDTSCCIVACDDTCVYLAFRYACSPVLRLQWCA